jgi:hypothetical protein
MNRHLLIMILCCAIPLALIIALPYLKFTFSSNGWFLLVLLLCPIAHLFMMCGHSDHQKPKGGDAS